MKKEAKDWMLAGVLGTENLGPLTAAAHGFLSALESRCKDRKTGHFFWVPISPCAFRSLLYLWDCYITKMCSFDLHTLVSWILMIYICTNLSYFMSYVPMFFAQIFFPLAFSFVQFCPTVLVIPWLFHFKNYVSSKFLISVQLFDFSEFSLAQVSYLI